MAAAAFECTVLPESCPMPQVCYYIFNNLSNVVGTFCGCQGNFGFVGMPECTTKTTASNLITAYFSILFIVFAPLLVFNGYLIGRRYWRARGNKVEFRRMFFTEVGMATILSEIALFSLVVAIILSLAGIANPQWAQSRQDGARLPYMFRIRSFFLAIAESLFLAVCILIAGTCKFIFSKAIRVSSLKLMTDKVLHKFKGIRLQRIQLC